MTDIENNAARSLESVTAEDFLRAVFGERWRDAWIAAVPDMEPKDKTEAIEKKRALYGGRAGQYPLASLTETNNYYAMGMIRGEPGASRMLHMWEYGPVVVLDDVGEKTGDDGAPIREELGEPSFVIQTSNGSQQWGYILAAPITDAKTMATITRALTLKFYPGEKDPGHEAIVQYLRLPCGVNNKAKRVAENGGVAPRVRLVEWRPDLKHEPLDIQIALSAVWDNAESTARGASGAAAGPTSEVEARAYETRDPILAGLDAKGMVRWDDVRNGFIGVQCPWHASHTVQDDSEGYNPETGVFKCFHTTHGTKSADDVRDWLRVELGEQRWQEVRTKAAAAIFGAHPLPDQSAFAANDNKPVMRKWREAGAGVPIEARPARRVVSTMLVRGAVTQLGSQPNVGKSQLAVNLVYSLAAERHDLFGEPQPFERTGGAVVITNEDGADEFMRRRDAFLRAAGLSSADLKHRVLVNEATGFKVVHKRDKFAPVEVTPEMRGLEDDIKAARAGGDEIAVVVVDTQAASFGGLDENNNAEMAQAGAVLGAWAEALDVCLLLLHHTTKEAGKSGAVGLTAMRGASAMGGSVRCAAQLLPLTPEQEAKLPESERGSWIKLAIVKASYSKFGRDRWFQKLGVQMAARADDGSMAPGESTAACLYRPTGPQLGIDTSADANVFRAAHAVIEAHDAGDPALSAVSGKGNRGCVLIGKALAADSSDGAKMQRELQRRGLVDEFTEPVPGRAGRTRTILKPTDAGRAFVQEWQQIHDSLTVVDDGIAPSAPAEGAAGEPSEAA